MVISVRLVHCSVVNVALGSSGLSYKRILSTNKTKTKHPVSRKGQEKIISDLK